MTTQDTIANSTESKPVGFTGESPIVVIDGNRYKLFDVNTVSPLTVEELENWIDVLKNGNSEGKVYKPTSGYLKQIEKKNQETIQFHCCLGVLAQEKNMLSKSTMYDNNFVFALNDGKDVNTINVDFYDSYLKIKDTPEIGNNGTTIQYFLSYALQSQLARINDDRKEDNYDEVISVLENKVLPVLKEYEATKNV